MLASLIAHRDLMSSLVRRQYLLRYRQSFAGFAWALLPALAMMAMATLVFHRIAGIEGSENVPYSLFALAALAPWTLFASGVTQGVPSVVQSSTMITRLSFPRAVLPLSMLGTAVLDLAITGAVFIAFVFISGYHLPLTALWAFPLIALELVLTAGVVLLTSALNVFARDVKLAIPLVTQLWLFLTPVVYPLSSVEEFRQLYLLNPMTGLIESFRTVLLPPGGPPEAAMLVPSAIGAVVLFLFGWWYFGSVQNRFADVV